MELVLRQFSACANEVDVFQNLMDCAARIMYAEMATVQRMEPDYLQLRLVGQRGFSKDFEEHFQVVDRYSGSVCSRAMLHRAPFMVEDTMRDAACERHRSVFKAAHIRAVVSIPVMSPHGAFCGMVSTHKSVPGLPSDFQMEKLKEVASQSAQAIFAMRTAAGRPRF
jgi:GAF domain-containing protein